MTAIYARQSINKKDSISIETQIEACKRCTDGEFRVYSDKGWSGKDLDRPQFQQLLRDIRSGEISKATFVVDSVKSWVIDGAQIRTRLRQTSRLSRPGSSRLEHLPEQRAFSSR